MRCSCLTSSSFVVLALALSNSAFADDASLGTMTVTATKSVKDTSEAPAAVSVVTSQEIEKMNVQSPDEALKFLPGAYATKSGGSHQPSVMGTNVLLRGIPDYSRTLVLVDGQPLNDPYIGAVTWESVPTEIVQRIEVVPGPFSSLYGGNAMGGVINIITKTPTKRETTVKLGYGTDAYRNGTIVYQDRWTDKVGVMFDYSYRRSDGYVQDDVLVDAGGAGGTTVTGAKKTTDPYGNTKYLVGDKGDVPWNSRNLGAKLFFDLTSDSRLTLGASHFTYERELGRFNTYLRDASENPVSSGDLTLAGTGTNISLTESKFLSGPNPKEQNRYTAEYRKDMVGGASITANVSYMDIPTYDYVVPFGTLDGGGGKRLHRPNSELAGSVQYNFPLSVRHFLVTGISAGNRKIETYSYGVSDWRDEDAKDTLQNKTEGEDNYYAAYVQDEYDINDAVTAYFGGRYDYWTTEGYLQDVAAGTPKDEYDSRHQDYFSPKVSVVYRPDGSTTLRASAGSAFHAPMLRDTFGWWTPASGKTYVPNPNLKPETVKSWEIGVEKRFGAGMLFRATYYENYLEDLIYHTSDATTESVTNAGKASIKGIELELRKRLGHGLSAFVNATYNDSEITDNPIKPETEGKQLTNTPEKMANIGLQGDYGPWQGSIQGHYVGKVYANDENLDKKNGVYGSIDPHFVADAKVAYTVKKWLQASLAIDNLLDRDYYDGTYSGKRVQGRAYYGELTFKF